MEEQLRAAGMKPSVWLLLLSWLLFWLLFWLLSWLWYMLNPMNGTSRVKTVKVRSVRTDETFGADDEILEEVKTLLSPTTQVEITDDQQCDIVIVFCPVTPHVGSDVSAAMRRIPGDKRVILVLMHHTRDVDFSTDGRRWSETFQNVVLDVHVLFYERLRGLLKCARNDEAVQQIQEVLKALSR